MTQFMRSREEKAYRSRKKSGEETMEQYEDRNVLMARAIAARVAEAGGRSFYVGGLVRDHILAQTLAYLRKGRG